MQLNVADGLKAFSAIVAGHQEGQMLAQQANQQRADKEYQQAFSAQEASDRDRQEQLSLRIQGGQYVAPEAQGSYFGDIEKDVAGQPSFDEGVYGRLSPGAQRLRYPQGSPRFLPRGGQAGSPGASRSGAAAPSLPTEGLPESARLQTPGVLTQGPKPMGLAAALLPAFNRPGGAPAPNGQAPPATAGPCGGGAGAPPSPGQGKPDLAGLQQGASLTSFAQGAEPFSAGHALAANLKPQFAPGVDPIAAGAPPAVPAATPAALGPPTPRPQLQSPAMGLPSNLQAPQPPAQVGAGGAVGDKAVASGQWGGTREAGRGSGGVAPRRSDGGAATPSLTPDPSPLTPVFTDPFTGKSYPASEAGGKLSTQLSEAQADAKEALSFIGNTSFKPGTPEFLKMQDLATRLSITPRTAADVKQIQTAFAELAPFRPSGSASAQARDDKEDPKDVAARGQVDREVRRVTELIDKSVLPQTDARWQHAQAFRDATTGPITTPEEVAKATAALKDFRQWERAFGPGATAQERARERKAAADQHRQDTLAHRAEVRADKLAEQLARREERQLQKTEGDKNRAANRQVAILSAMARLDPKDPAQYAAYRGLAKMGGYPVPSIADMTAPAKAGRQLSPEAQTHDLKLAWDSAEKAAKSVTAPRPIIEAAAHNPKSTPASRALFQGMLKQLDAAKTAKQTYLDAYRAALKARGVTRTSEQPAAKPAGPTGTPGTSKYSSLSTPDLIRQFSKAALAAASK